MAILPRTVLAQPAAAAVATVALFGFTVIGLAAHSTVKRAAPYDAHPCAELAAQTPGTPSSWSEYDWVRLTECFVAADDVHGALKIASEGVVHHPTSEALVNLKGYHEIGVGSYYEAIDTLEQGLNYINPRSGVLENNLAWAYLYVGEGDAARTRELYQRALMRSPGQCELIHTGLFVEFEQAANAGTLARSAALIRFSELQTQYSSCMMRDSDADTGVEAIGVAVLYGELLRDFSWDATMMRSLTTKRAVEVTAGMSAGEVCTEAMPIERLRTTCVELVQATR